MGLNCTNRLCFGRIALGNDLATYLREKQCLCVVYHGIEPFAATELPVMAEDTAGKTQAYAWWIGLAILLLMNIKNLPFMWHVSLKKMCPSSEKGS